MMPAKISRRDLSPVSARSVAYAHPLPDLGFGEPAGVSGKAGRGTVGTVAPARSSLSDGGDAS